MSQNISTEQPGQIQNCACALTLSSSSLQADLLTIVFLYHDTAHLARFPSDSSDKMVRFTTSFLAPLALAATAAIVQVSAKTSLYLSPANHLAAAPISINAEEAHRVLSNHINVGDASGSDDSAIWAHVLRNDKVDQRARVERLFDGHQDEPNRLLVLMHGSAHDGE